MYWLGVHATPYNTFLLTHVKIAGDLTVRVFYSRYVIANLKWHAPTGGDESVYEGRLFVKLSIFKAALSSRHAFVVVGWNDGLKLGVMIARRILGLKFALWTDTVRESKGGLKDRLRSKFLKWLTTGNVVFTTGEVGVRAFRSEGLAPDATPVLNLPFYVPVPQEVPPKGRSKCLRILCCGRLVHRKGVDIAIRSVAHCISKCAVEVRLIIAGIGPNEAELKRLAREYQLDGHVTFAGWLDGVELAALRDASDILLHAVPSHDPFPVVVLEAMASGLVVLASRFAQSAVERIVDGESGLFVDPARPDCIGELIAELSRERDRVARMSCAARQVALQWPVDRGATLIRQFATGAL
jgi:glycosyltransferase involved in cell wall biosynthesis